MSRFSHTMQSPAAMPSGGAAPENSHATAIVPSENGSEDQRDSVWAARPSNEEAKLHLDHVRALLKKLRTGDMPRLSSVAWPADLDRRAIATMSLRMRTQNCLSYAGIADGQGELTVHDLMRIPNFGQRSLQDLLVELERFLGACIQDETPPLRRRVPTSQESSSIGSSRRDMVTAVQTQPSEWEHAAAVLGSLLTAAAELKDVETISDALSGEISDLARKMGLSTELESIRVENLAIGARGPISTTVGRLEEMLLAMTARQRSVVKHRLLRNPPSTLAEVGALVGVTRERIRQVQVTVEKWVAQALGPEMPLVASVLHQELAPIIEEQAFNHLLDAKLGNGTGQAERLFRNAIVAEMGYLCQSDAYINKEARWAVAEIRLQAPVFADDVGLVDVPRLLADLLDEDWHQHWPLLRRCTGLHDLNGSLSIRDSAKARAKSALLSIGRAATREEVAEVCGLSSAQTAGAFSNIRSVVKASKDQWALKEWVDDEYDGIVGEIVQRINEDGGTTKTERLLRELPEKFGVSSSSVRAYMHTPKFVIQDGWIRRANASSIELRSLDDAVDGRDAEGAPYWTFTVECRLFNGYSVVGVPPEFAKALGCKPDGGTRVRVENLPMCRDLSVRWRLASTTGASLGYVADPLKKLGVQAGQFVRVTLKGPNRVTLTENVDPVHPPPDRGADAILERIKKRRQVF